MQHRSVKECLWLLALNCNNNLSCLLSPSPQLTSDLKNLINNSNQFPIQLAEIQINLIFTCKSKPIDLFLFLIYLAWFCLKIWSHPIPRKDLGPESLIRFLVKYEDRMVLNYEQRPRRFSHSFDFFLHHRLNLVFPWTTWEFSTL